MEKKDLFEHNRGEVNINAIRQEIYLLEKQIEELRIAYEQHFTGLLPQPPEKLHKEVQRLLRRLLQAPFRNSELVFRLKALQGRYQTYNTYWTRVTKQREEGRYFKDMFKAKLRQQQTVQARASTNQGSEETVFKQLYETFCHTLNNSGKKGAVPQYTQFEAVLKKKLNECKKKHPGREVKFKLVKTKEGVRIKAEVR
ncbi:MAG: hypothetical protein D6780_07060 [Candidatus Dadabacteria bacterium]|nr:MAG: hypothetical protein D6780_07060 [Candidatus Dadabacteria bacterium]